MLPLNRLLEHRKPALGGYPLWLEIDDGSNPALGSLAFWLAGQNAGLALLRGKG
jgi:hypothetical protein